MISHYSMLGELSNRSVIKGTRMSETLGRSTINYFNLVADLKRKDLKPLIKGEKILESNIVLNLEAQGPILVKKKK